jgi:hypothetical protein
MEDLKTLPVIKLQEAATIIHRLREDVQAHRHEALQRSLSFLNDADGADLEHIIESNFEQVNPCEW